MQILAVNMIKSKEKCVFKGESAFDRRMPKSDKRGVIRCIKKKKQF